MLAVKLAERYPDHVGVVLHLGVGHEPDIKKFVVPGEMTCRAFMCRLPDTVQLDKNETYYLLTESKGAVHVFTTIGDLHYRHKNATDGLLHLHHCKETAFG